MHSANRFDFITYDQSWHCMDFAKCTQINSRHPTSVEIERFYILYYTMLMLSAHNSGKPVFCLMLLFVFLFAMDFNRIGFQKNNIISQCVIIIILYRAHEKYNIYPIKII